MTPRELADQLAQVRPANVPALALLLVSKDLDIRATYLDLLTGSARSVAIEKGDQ